MALLALNAIADDRLKGSWTLDGQRSDDVDKAINDTVRKMNVLARGIARGRLRKTNPAYSTISIAFTNQSALIATGGTTLNLPLSGAPVKWNRDGENINVSGRKDGSSYVETFDAKDGKRTNLFSVDGDAMTLSVTVTSPRLKTPLKYRLVYRRA